jgi:hypothetical protein
MRPFDCPDIMIYFASIKVLGEIIFDSSYHRIRVENWKMQSAINKWSFKTARTGTLFIISLLE